MMSNINIEGYSFEGPFTSTSLLKEMSGVYVVLGKSTYDNRWTVVDVGESAGLRTRIENHDRKPCWNGHGYDTLAVAAFYTNEGDRMNLEGIIRRKYNPPCGER